MGAASSDLHPIAGPPDVIDLDAYLSRIGHQGSRSADLATLRSIVAGQATSIPFENLDPFLGRPVELDLPALQSKLVEGRRGGFCFEHNLLLAHALRALGFTVTGLAARVLWNRPPGLPPPARGHMLLRVDLDEGPYVVDTGFGGLTLTDALRLAPDIEQPTSHEPFRLVLQGDEHRMQAGVGGEWRTLYQFGLLEQHQADYEVTSWYLSNHPESHFVTGLIAARPDRGLRYAINGNRFTTHQVGGASVPRTLTGPAELLSVLEHEIGIDLSGLDRARLAAEVARLW